MAEEGLIEKAGLFDLNIRTKLLISFGFVALLVGLTGFVGVYGISTVGANADGILEDEVPVADASMEMRIAVNEERAALHAYMLGETEAREEFRTAREEFEKWHSTVAERDDLTTEERQILSSVADNHQEAASAAQTAMDAKDSGYSATATENMNVYDQANEKINSNLGEFEELTGQQMDEAMAAADGTQSQTRLILIGLSIMAFLVAIGIGLVVAGRMTRPIVQLSEASKAMSEGDLSTDVGEHNEDDEISQMVESFKRMQSILRGVFDEIDTFSDNLAGGDADLSEREMQTDYPGSYGDIMRNLQAGSAEMTGSFAEIQKASHNLQNGDLENEIDTDRPGEYGNILQSIDDGITTLSESFGQIGRVSEGLRDGRLDQEIDTDKPGMYGQVMADLEAGLRDLDESIAEVQNIADTVADTSDAVSASTEEIESASKEVAESVQEISHGADEQSENMQQAATELNDLSATVEEIASSATQVEENAREAVDIGDTGRQNASEATAEIVHIEEEAEEAVDQVSELDEQMEQIGEIVQMINEIAEQTNLLALNASIEAARAGEAGEGFAVVADEIKTLAGEAGDATSEIEERIEEVQRSTSETVEGIEEMKESVESGAETIERTIQMFDDIAESINEVEDGVTEISEATDDQATSTEEVVAMVDEVSSVAEETAAEASNVSAAAEEQTSSLTDVGENVENLSEVATELHDLVGEFEVTELRASPDETDMAPQQDTAVTDGGQSGSGDGGGIDWVGNE